MEFKVLREATDCPTLENFEGGRGKNLSIAD